MIYTVCSDMNNRKNDNENVTEQKRKNNFNICFKFYLKKRAEPGMTKAEAKAAADRAAAAAATNLYVVF
jgi:hypothetical protein